MLNVTVILQFALTEGILSPSFVKLNHLTFSVLYGFILYSTVPMYVQYCTGLHCYGQGPSSEKFSGPCPKSKRANALDRSNNDS